MMNRRRTAKLNVKLDTIGRAFGHSFGVLGAIMGLNAIATSIDPQLLQLFPLRDIGIQQTSAALISVGLIALAAWLVTERRRPPAKPNIDPPEAP